MHNLFTVNPRFLSDINIKIPHKLRNDLLGALTMLKVYLYYSHVLNGVRSCTIHGIPYWDISLSSVGRRLLSQRLCLHYLIRPRYKFIAKLFLLINVNNMTKILLYRSWLWRRCSCCNWLLLGCQNLYIPFEQSGFFLKSNVDALAEERTAKNNYVFVKDNCSTFNLTCLRILTEALRI